MSFRRIIFILMIVILIVGVSAFRYFNDDDYEELTRYCAEICEVLEDKEFSWARLAEGTVRLYARDGTLTETIRLDHWDKRLSRQIHSIGRDGHAVRFILYGVVDDEVGILIPEESYNHVLHRINTLERTGGRSYKYEK